MGDHLVADPASVATHTRGVERDTAVETLRCGRWCNLPSAENSGRLTPASSPGWRSGSTGPGRIRRNTRDRPGLSLLLFLGNLRPHEQARKVLLGNVHQPAT